MGTGRDEVQEAPSPSAAERAAGVGHGPVPVLRASELSMLRRPTGSWVPLLYLAMSLVMLPWTIVLLQTLPDRAVSHNYRLAWVGFDVLLMLSMSRTAWLAWRRSPFVVNVASATATLLVVDAWFDVTTSSARGMLEACLLALFVELPAAVLSLLIAGRAQEQIARTGATRPHSVLWGRRRRPRPVPPVEGIPKPTPEERV